MHADLGDWIWRCLKRGIHEQGTAAETTLSECDAMIEDLQHQWALQQQSQLSICAHAFFFFHIVQPEPDYVLQMLLLGSRKSWTLFALQGDLDASDKAL
jgi:hypothetical protein